MTSDNVAATAAASPVLISRRHWRQLLAELERRGGGYRESGAFLLAASGDNDVRAIAYYDDLDANCLTGGISFASTGFTRLWQMCSDERLRVVADVHTHPGPWVGQSSVDSSNPMISTRGHVAIVVPNYGRATSIEECGVHIYLGAHEWLRIVQEAAATRVRIYEPLSRDSARALAARAQRRLSRLHGGGLSDT